jgi:predicted Zn-dependent protease
MALHASGAGMRKWRVALCLVLVSMALLAAPSAGQTSGALGSRGSDMGDPGGSAAAEAELQQGIALSKQSRFQEAIPHFLAARGRVRQEFAAEFNLALCYVATGQYKAAVEILTALRSANPGNASVYNLLAQAYVGNEQLPDAVEAVRKAAAITPKDEKLYLLVADACMERQQYPVGLDVANLGLKYLPNSARLLYQRAMFLTLLDQFDAGRSDFDQVVKLAGGTGIAYLAAAQKATFEGDMPAVIRSAREGLRKDSSNPALLTILGEALLRTGVMPGQPEFTEAVSALEKAVVENPASPVARIALGKLYLMDDCAEAARMHLEAARELDPLNPAVYSNLAKAYRRLGDSAKAQETLTVLAKLNEAQADKIRSSPGERKASYLGSRPESAKPEK